MSQTHTHTHRGNLAICDNMNKSQCSCPQLLFCPALIPDSVVASNPDAQLCLPYLLSIPFTFLLDLSS
jgi:hypothetical protein